MATTGAEGRRLRSLDGLRGLAALVVVLHHSLLLLPSLAGAYEYPRWVSSGPAWALTWTPLHLLWDGPAAVTVFFVLSGLVLTLGAERLGTVRGWAAWYPARLLRLYVPTTAAVLTAVGLYAAVPRESRLGLSWWLRFHDAPLPWTDVVKCLVLVTGTTSLNSALWSLRWEVIFSLTLPLFLLLGRGGRAVVAAQATALLAAMVLGGGSHLSARYLPVFGLGVLLARQLRTLAPLAARLQPRVWVGTGVVGVLLLEAPWLLGPTAPPRWAMVAPALTAIGATVCVWMFAHCPPLAGLASRPAAAWLGTVSFSLYLVHEPVVVSVGFLLSGRVPMWLVVPAAVALGLGAGWAFHRTIERPAHRLARRVARSGWSEVAQPVDAIPAQPEVRAAEEDPVPRT